MAIYSLHHRPITRTGKCAQTQPYTSAAHCSYITRESAVTEVLSDHIPSNWSAACRWFVNMENHEHRKNARFTEKVLVALPIELSHEQRAELVRDFCNTVGKGRVPWLAAIHDGPLDWDNPHAHLIFRDRDIETGKTVIKASDYRSTVRLREIWEERANAHLERAGLAERIDRRSLEDQGLAREPGIHIGPKSKALQENGITPGSKIIEVRRLSDGTVQTIRVDYATIDQGRTRSAENEDRQRRNAARGLVPRKLKWNTGAGMAAQQRSATSWMKRSWKAKKLDKTRPTGPDQGQARRFQEDQALTQPGRGLSFFEDRAGPNDMDRSR